MAAGDPTGGDLCSVTVAANTLPITFSEDRNTFVFDTTAVLASGKQYAIVVDTTGVTEAENIEWAQKLSDAYAGGLKCISDDGGSTWTQVSTRDCDFATIASEVTKDEYVTNQSWQAIYDPYVVAQTFTTTSSYTIDSVELRIRQDKAGGGIAGDVTVSIKKVEGESYGPTKPTNPTPADEGTDIDFSNFTLEWDDGGDGADTYDVYLGPTSGDLTLVSSAQEGTSYVTNSSELVTLFGEWPTIDEMYWRVDATKDEETTTGDEWHFATAPKVNYARLGATGNFILCTTTRGLYLSTDFGSNWTQSLPDSDDTTEWNRGVCSGTGTYMIVERDSDHALYRSANGGSSWGAITPAGGDTFAVYDMAMSEDGQFVVIVGANSTTAINSCYVSTNYGVSWTAYTPNSQTARTWYTCSISDNGQVIGVADINQFYMSFDSGTSWQEQFPPASESLWNYLSISGDGKVGIITNSGTVNEWFQNSGYHTTTTVGSTSLTSFARTLIDDANAAEALTTLGAQTQGDVLDDLNSLGPSTADGEFLVATGAGALAWESGATARTSIGLGAGNSVVFTDLTLSVPSNIYALSHDSFAGFVSDEHVAHSGVSVLAGTGMSGGGTIDANVTLNCSITQYTDSSAKAAIVAAVVCNDNEVICQSDELVMI